MVRLVALTVALFVLAALGFTVKTSLERDSPPPVSAAPPEPPAEGVARPSRPAEPAFEQVRWRRSRALGRPEAGRLVNGVRLPAEGATFFTWDPVYKRSPNRPWRRWGTDRLVRTTLRVLHEFAVAHPHAPRIGVGDLSRPHGGDFGLRFGSIGHVSHQNGLDVDIYYPRRDRRERTARSPSQVNRRLAQDLVDRFIRAGAVVIFVGPDVGLTGPPSIVQPRAHHDNHLHVRLGPDPR